MERKLQRVAACCSASQCVAVWYIALYHSRSWCRVEAEGEEVHGCAVKVQHLLNKQFLIL